MNNDALKAQVEKRRSIYNQTHHASEISTIPDGSHFAVLCNESLRYDDGYGDDRHGPSYSTKNFIEYIFFDTPEALSAWLIENHSKKTFKVVKVNKVDFEMETKITVKE